MFELTPGELKEWRSQYGTSNVEGGDKMGLRYMPYVFTEQGVAMLSSVLNSEKAIKVNIQIIRIFNRMREMLLNYKDVLLKLERLEQQTLRNTADIQDVFAYLKKLLVPAEQAERQRIGFRRANEK